MRVEIRGNEMHLFPYQHLISASLIHGEAVETLHLAFSSHDVEIAGDAVRSEQRAGAPGGVERDAAVVPLEEAGLHRVELSLLLEPGVVERQQRGLDDLGRDVGQLRLHQLLGGDGDPNCLRSRV